MRVWERGEQRALHAKVGAVRQEYTGSQPNTALELTAKTLAFWPQLTAGVRFLFRQFNSEMTMGYNFVSYSRKDIEIINKLADTLQSAGYLVWIDHHTEAIPGGSLWRKEIVDAIEKADLFLLALSPQSTKSDEVRKELDIASEKKTRIIPIEVESTVIPNEMAYNLAGLQRIDLTTDWDKGVKRLLYVLRKTSEAETTSQMGIDEEWRKKTQSILNDTSLSITDKIEEVFTILFKNLNNRGKEATDKFAKLVEQKGVVDNEFFRIFERRVGLEQELWENHSLTKHIREILRREIQSLITKEDELRKESEELGKDYVKVQNEMEEIHNRWAKVYNLYKKEVFDPHMEIILKLSRK